MPVTESTFRFALNVSTGTYPDAKPRRPWTIQYATQSLTVSELDDLQRQGKSFCYLFKGRDESGLVTQKQKTVGGFDSTNVIFYDIDKMDMEMNDYILRIPQRPSMAYTTMSNGINGRYGYRLIYVFREPITTVEDFDRIYYAVAAANGFRQREYPDGTKYEFDYLKVNQQYFGGGIRSESTTTDLVYSISDFDSFVDDGENLKRQIEGERKNKNKKKNSPSQNNIGEAQGEQAYYSGLDSTFSNDIFKLSPKDFLETYEKAYFPKYLGSLSSPLTLSSDRRYWLYPEDYQEVKRNWQANEDGKRSVHLWPIGSNRKRRLYITAQIMRHNCPDISKEELVYGLIYERYHYFVNTDNKLNNNVIIDIAESSMKHEIELQPCKHPAFSVNKDCLSGNLTANSLKNTIRKERKEEEILAVYDFSLSVKENLSLLREKGIKTSRSYLFNFVKKYSPNQNNIGGAQGGQAYYSHLDCDEDSDECTKNGSVSI